MASSVTVRAVSAIEDLEIARLLLREYAAYLNQSLGEEHICLSSYEQELVGLPGAYASPAGVILLAFQDDEPAGCVALKPLKPERAIEREESACEMKRLWVRPQFRRLSIGLVLAQALIRYAQSRGYTAMYLDTVPAAMRSANRMYQELGFVPVERYTTNPILGAHPMLPVEFFRLSL
ncbi:Histone acetyltransferase HPA2 [Acidisarcina polymorpha]|uniref:Histone acetyltransferase HPA2 n=1 Tax=Acidisarcina polymorpha TaxID=2211140 RepID=A0A2Z5FUF3_9BACT|nr:GNAT family N-acetyltransferase [Acidisarcina polymorpha]AXC10509.1 Histone acetyltransferase HPA2 [Acidisarcina polymorpha]